MLLLVFVVSIVVQKNSMKQELNKKNRLGLTPLWRLYLTERKGWAVRDVNDTEWGAIILNTYHKKIAYKILDKSGCNWEKI